MSIFNIGGPKIVGTDFGNGKTVALNSQNTSAQIQIADDSKYKWSTEIIYASGSLGWLSLNPKAGPPGQTIDISVKGNTAGLTRGTSYIATVYFRLDGPSDNHVGTLVVKFTP
ncbi:MAG TPA: hypothetical protein VKU38_11185 [Ktedonobacteraceae bacterium]|nr:hypothetical protein [Ktedonobacteraceae bacterium]